jgi:hypothetical protein
LEEQTDTVDLEINVEDQMADLWGTRAAALATLAGELRDEAMVIEEAFGHLDESILNLEKLDTSFSRICGLTLVKARNLALGSYGLCLDGLAQETGALMRPLIEALELLIYFRLEPTRVDEAIEGKLPSAGKRAQVINGHFKEARDYWNENASHLSFTPDSIRHLLDFKESRWRVTQPHSTEVLRRNLQFFFAVLIWVAIEGVNCLGTAGELIQHGLGDRIEELKNRALAVFDRHDKSGADEMVGG